MHATTPPYTKTAKQVYDETSVIAAAQDAKLDPGNDALPSILADFRAVVKRLEAYAERLRVSRNLTELAAESQKLGLYDDGIPAESAYLLKNGSRIATSAEVEGLRTFLDVATLHKYGLGDVEPRDVAKTATTVATSQHPMAAEALRDEYEKTDGETGV